MARTRTTKEAVWTWDGALVESQRLTTASRLTPGQPMSRMEVAAVFKVSRSAVQRWETPLEAVRRGIAASRPDGATIGRLASLYGCEPSSFYRMAEPQ